MTAFIGTAADARYGTWVLNLIGSIKRRSDVFERIVVHDLGLTGFQRRLLAGIDDVEVRPVPPFVPHWRQGFTWKPWAQCHLESDVVVWLDAGLSVLRPLDGLLDQIERRGYFVVSQDVPLSDAIPSDYYALYGLSPRFGSHVTVAAGILGFRRDSAFFDNVVVKTYEDALRGRTLGFSPSEVAKLNRGAERVDQPILRDAPRFRHDQTILNIHFYSAIGDPYLNELDRYGGYRSPHDHPEQVIWGHRRRGDYRFLPRIPYRPSAAVIGIPWGLWTFLRANRRWLLRPTWLLRRAPRVTTLLRRWRMRGLHRSSPR